MRKVCMCLLCPYLCKTLWLPQVPYTLYRMSCVLCVVLMSRRVRAPLRHFKFRTFPLVRTSADSQRICAVCPFLSFFFNRSNYYYFFVQNCVSKGTDFTFCFQSRQCVPHVCRHVVNKRVEYMFEYLEFFFLFLISFSLYLKCPVLPCSLLYSRSLIHSQRCLLSCKQM